MLEPSLSQTISPRVKICGITSVNDAISAANLGADAIGLVFYEPSPRYIDIETAALIANAVGPFVTTVGLFVDAEASFVNQVLNQVPLQLLQFHGNETSAFCEQFNRPYIKALRMKPDVDVDKTIEEYPNASGILLDAYRKGVPGGTGETFDWARVPKQCNEQDAKQGLPIILAGGLNPENVQSAIQQTLPYAVDVSGGVERTNEPNGAENKNANTIVRKDHEKIKQFIQRAKAAV